MTSRITDQTRIRFPDTDPWSGDELLRRRRNLPHLEMRGVSYFLTFRSNIVLSAPARDIVLAEIERCSGTYFDLLAAVVMPDHVHLIFHLLREERISHVLQLIKGRSAKTVNQLLGRKGPFWMDESFDRIMRNATELEEKIEYIRQNPVKKGLVTQPSDYQWLFVAGSMARSPSDQN
jgi:REP element-mobilizing transposase RayT